MNSAFLNLAKNDDELIQDIKSAIINMHTQAVKRETLYLAIEHNTRYLCEITKAADARAINAEQENVKMKEDLITLKVDHD